MRPGPRNGSAGTTAYLLPRFPPIEFSNSPPSQRFGAASQRSAARILCGAGYAVVHPGFRRASLAPRTQGSGGRPPAPCRGGGAPRGAAGILSCRAPSRERGRLSALHVRRFRIPGSAFPGFRPGFLRRPRRQFASSACRALAGPETGGTVPVQQAPCGAVLVPPDRFPRPPEREVTSLARGRRAPPRFRDVS